MGLGSSDLGDTEMTISEVSPDLPRQSGGSNGLDDDGRHGRTDKIDVRTTPGTAWTACVRVIAAVIGSGVLSLAWTTAQLGWITGPAAILWFSCVTCSSSAFLANCYRCGNPVTGERNYSYMDAVHSILGRSKAKLCGLVQNLNLFGAAIAVTISSSISMMIISRSSCFHNKGDNSPCHISSNAYMIAFGVIEIFLSQIPNFDQQWWLPIVAVVMSFTYSAIGFALSIAKVAENGKFRGSLTGISIGTLTQTQKIWRSFQALGGIAFAYSYSIILIEIQDTVRSPPSETKTMRKAVSVSMAVVTLFYTLCGCMGYGAFGDMAPGHLLAGLGSVGPYWLSVVANVAIVIHLAGAYQVYSQPVFAFIEKHATKRFADNQFITKEIEIRVPGFRPFKLYVFRLIGRTFFVMVTTVISMLLPFFNDVIGLVGALGFWPLTAYFPITMYIAQMEIPKWSTKWLCLQILSVACLIISIAAAAGSIAGVVLRLESYKPFSSGKKSFWLNLPETSE